MAIYMEIPEIDGSATTKGFEKQLPVFSLGFGTTQASQPDSDSDDGWSNAEAFISPVTVSKKTDKTTPILMEKCCSAEHFEKVTFTLTRTVKGKVEPYMKVVINDVLITDINFSGDADGESSETITLLFQQIVWEYGKIQKGGSGKDNTTGSWNLETGTREV